METRLHELEYESKMRLKTHPHTSERRDYKADKDGQTKKGKKGGISVRDNKNVKETIAI